PFDPEVEQPITLSAVTRLPFLGRRVSPATVYRWCRRGVRAIRRETIVIGTTTYTSKEALKRFIAKTSAAPVSPAPADAGQGEAPMAAVPKPATAKTVGEARRELGAAGVR